MYRGAFLIQLDYEPLPPIKEGLCGAPSPILLKSVGSSPAVAIDPPATVTCTLAKALSDWLTETVQPQAMTIFNSAVTKVHAGSYACRNRNSAVNRPLSEHALANAIDISDFVLVSGEQIAVAETWPSDNPPLPVPNPDRVDLFVNEKGLKRLPQVSVQYCEPARPCTYLVGVGSHRRWELMLNPGEEPDAWELLARWITPDDAQLWRAASYRFHALVAREWRRGRVFLAGDAAHQQPPFTGQGMCQGIRDAANLSWKLHHVLTGKAKERLLDTYEVERRAHAKRLISTVKEIGAVICERNPEKARARDRFLLAEAGGKVATVPRQHLIPPLERGFLSSRPHPANGTLFPKDGGTGLRTVRAEGSEGVVAEWFKQSLSIAAIVRPDHYVYGVARDPASLDRMLKEMAKGLK